MLRLRQRRGAFVVMTGVMFFALIVCGAVAIDFSRLWTERWELQTAADAGSIAGAMQLMPPRDSLRYADSARAYVWRNRAMADTITVDSVIKGNWDGPTRTWTPAGDPSNAVRVVVSQRASNLFMAGFGVPVPRMMARSIAWAGAPVATTNACMKPWAIPYEELMYRINVWRAANEPGFPYVPANTTANMTRPFDQVGDLAALQQMSAADRTFRMKLGSSPPSGVYDPNTTGNYQAVKLGKYWDYATQSVANPGPDNGGASAYEGHIEGSTCHGLAVGDSLESEQGNMVGPTMDGMCKNGNISGLQTCNTPAVCTQLDARAGGGYGDCYDSSGQVGVDVKSAFFSCYYGCNGSSKYEVRLLGSFTIKKAYPDKDKGKTPQWDKSEIVGEFKPVMSQGAGGGGSTTLVKLILVQ
jgi:Flp pilus assembly protein TadG